MNSEDIINALLKQDEGEQLMFYTGNRKETVGQVICSFLNQKGGHLLMGLSDQKKVVGVDSAQKLQKELEQYLLSEIAPEAPMMVSLETYQQKDLLLIKVWPGSKQPYVFGGSIYYRQGKRTIRASSQQISELIHNRQQTDVHWERQPVLGVELDDLDMDEIQDTMETSVSSHKTREAKTNALDFLSYYGLYQNGYFTNAAVILFAKNPTRFIPQSRVRISFLSEGKTGNRFLDDQFLEGNLFKNLEEILNFFNRHLSHTSTFSPSNWQRKDDLIYPLAALREGVFNALIHRDYAGFSGTVSILLDPEHLEITNSGKLNLKVSDLKKNHLSMPVNPDIAHMVYLRGFIEKIGRGTLKILDACKEAGLRAPEWVPDAHSVKLTFFHEYQDKNRGLNEGLNDGLKSILGLIAEKPGIQAKDIAAHFSSRSMTTIERQISTLIDLGLIERRGSRKTGGYHQHVPLNDAIYAGPQVKSISEGLNDGLNDGLKSILGLIAEKPGIQAKDIAAHFSSRSMTTIERQISTLIDLVLIERRGSKKTGGYFLTAKVKKKIEGK